METGLGSGRSFLVAVWTVVAAGAEAAVAAVVIPMPLSSRVFLVLTATIAVAVAVVAARRRRSARATDDVRVRRGVPRASTPEPASRIEPAARAGPAAWIEPAARAERGGPTGPPAAAAFPVLLGHTTSGLPAPVTADAADGITIVGTGVLARAVFRAIVTGVEIAAADHDAEGAERVGALELRCVGDDVVADGQASLPWPHEPARAHERRPGAEPGAAIGSGLAPGVAVAAFLRRRPPRARHAAGDPTPPGTAHPEDVRKRKAPPAAVVVLVPTLDHAPRRRGALVHVDAGGIRAELHTDTATSVVPLAPVLPPRPAQETVERDAADNAHDATP